MTTTKYLETGETGTAWYVLNGTDNGTDIEFSDSVFGVTAEGTIVDCDNHPLTDGDYKTIAVRNSLGE